MEAKERDLRALKETRLAVARERKANAELCLRLQVYFFCDILIIFAIFGPFFHLRQLITRERIELRSWDWSHSKALRL